MKIRRKLTLMGICVGIILIVLTVNVIGRLQSNIPETEQNIVLDKDSISRAEAYRLLSYLEFNKKDREAIPKGISYKEQKMSDWYDTYVNAVWKMGLIDSSVTQDPREALTYGVCKQLIDQLILKRPEFQAAYTGLSFDFLQADKNMPISDFLELYQALINVIPIENRKTKEETLLVLGQEVTEDGTGRMITDQGKYYFLDAKSYVNFVKKDETQKSMQEVTKAAEVSQEGAKTTGTPEEAEKIAAAGTADPSLISVQAADTDTVKADTPSSLLEQYMDTGINALVSDQEIIYITALSTEQITVHNVWIKEGKDSRIDTFIDGIDKSFTAVSKLSTSIEKVIGDITIENKQIVKINVKPDMIKGKVLSTGDDFIEIEGYGKVPFDGNYKIYKIYGELSVEPTGSILVGYENTDFIVSDGKISAALITESIKAENIRVLIETSGYKDIYHNQVKFTANSDFTVSNKKKSQSYKKGDTVTIKSDDKLFDEGRITVKAASENAKIKLLSVERACGNPKYRGRLEISKEDGGLIVINELPLEEYLYAVIPSEMPTSYGVEALKVQAVCARSYAYRQLMANSLSKYGAHVNDSVAYQVYNNIPENEDSILAVKDTYGKVAEYNNNVITAYYFSTSCGHTTDPSSVWANSADIPYLNGKLILDEEDENGEGVRKDAQKLYGDLSSDKSFKSFIESDVATYDSSFNWYRWKVTIGAGDLKKVIDTNLANRYQANPDLIQTMTSKEGDAGKAVFESKPVDTIGDVVDISVSKRERSGIVSEMILTGSKNTVKVRTEYNIRALLAPTYDEVERLDKSKVENLSMLPSAFFRVDKKEKNGKLDSVKLTGGGYGHGVGMSQNAVKALVDSGKGYEDIIAYFYQGTTLGSIYQ